MRFWERVVRFFRGEGGVGVGRWVSGVELFWVIAVYGSCLSGSGGFGRGIFSLIRG